MLAASIDLQFSSLTRNNHASRRPTSTRLTKAGVYGRPIVTQVVKLAGFFPAEDYHQDFAEKNPTYPYIVYHDKPKVENLKQQFPELYR